MSDMSQVYSDILVLSSILDSIGESLFITDLNGKVFTTNRAFRELFGYDKEDFIRLDLLDTVKKLIELDDVPEQEILTNLELVLAGNTVVVERKYRHKNGSIVPVQVKCSPIYNSQGKSVGVLYSVKDKYSDIFKEVADILSSPNDLDEVLSKLVRRVPTYLGLLDALIFLVNPDTNSIYLRASSSILGEQMSAFSIPIHHPALVSIFLEAEFLEFQANSPLGKLLKFLPYYHDFKQGFVLPIKGRDKSMGALFLLSETARQFIPEERKLLDHVCKQVGILVGHLQQLARMERLSNTDELTGVSNHRHFQESLTAILNRVSLDNKSASLLMADIDYFKTYNDTFGHPAGDEVLREVARIIREHVRPTDVVARYGGEEFCVILPGCPVYIAQRIAERIREKVEAYPFWGRHELPKGCVTLSIGIAGYPDNAIAKDDLIKCADHTLYRAKHLGRNRVEVYHSVLDELKSQLDFQERDLLNTVSTLITVINAKDSYTYGHSERVTEYAILIGNELGLSEEKIKNMSYGAFLHDLGKIEIEREILNKTGKLTEDEFMLMRKHPVYGADLIRPITCLTQAIPIVLYHHERYDGLGYPTGLKGEAIPLEARIVCVADAYDAMTTTRPYKAAKSMKEALEELRYWSGVQFDPVIVETFIAVLNKKFGGGINA